MNNHLENEKKILEAENKKLKTRINRPKTPTPASNISKDEEKINNNTNSSLNELFFIFFKIDY